MVRLQTDEDASLVAVVRRHARERPDHCVLTWHDSFGESQDSLTYAELWGLSGAIADLLVKRGAKPGDRVMIAYPFGLSFMPGLIGCFRAGLVACSVYPPNPRQLASDMPKFEQFATDAGAKFACTSTKFMWLMRESAACLKPDAAASHVC